VLESLVQSLDLMVSVALWLALVSFDEVGLTELPKLRSVDVRE